MNEKDLQLARAMVEEEEARNRGGFLNNSRGSPAPLKKTPVGKVVEKMNAFRSEQITKKTILVRYYEIIEYNFSKNLSYKFQKTPMIHNSTRSCE